MKTTNNIIDITSLTELTIDALFAWKTGDEDFNYDALNINELFDLQRATGADLSLWIRDARTREAAARTEVDSDTRDYEAAILDAQSERYDAE